MISINATPAHSPRIPETGHEWDLVIADGVGLLLFILLMIYLSIKMGIKPTLELFGLWPRRRHGLQQETGTEDQQDNAGTGTR